jgi:hypothetical protein
MLCCMRTGDVDWQCHVDILCYGDLLEGMLFNVGLCETIMFIQLFNDADLKSSDYLPSNEKLRCDND